ncbi:ATP-binding protein [Mycobacterium sp. Aquia_213]|uniref:ATP-binding protein n=1 Tax=Mycobacterium sp. Aquia_213 TaxID=2991728 RepID=UPI002271FDD5|nr:ATP-binding protein [Mycobacterium sp. Aquia_213]WAC90693.1 ATP-binding protein [Mycobacterium sp. Aquia_213]
MLLKLVRPYFSITGSNLSEPLADFVVLSGANGSGKTQLLSGIETGNIVIEGLEFSDGERGRNIRWFPLGALSISGGGVRQIDQVQEPWVNIHNVLTNIRREIDRGQLQPTGSDRNQWIRETLVERGAIRLDAATELEHRSGKPIAEFSEIDFRIFSPFLMGYDPFTIGISDLFMFYHTRSARNQLSELEKLHGGDPKERPLSRDEFEKKNGPPPWNLLNDILGSIGIDYKFNHPTGFEAAALFDPLLTRPSGEQIEVNSLSSGEKVLLAVAMSLYTGSNHKESMLQMPKVLLLDEPDASLHPSMAKSLLRVLAETFVIDHKVKVIMTTHSPTTVALAPEESLFVMSPYGTPRIKKFSRDKALTGLLVGVPTLSVSNDHRRQVFVEAEDDQQCYQALFTKLKSEMQTPMSLVFIPSGTIADSNRYKVAEMVERLRSNGVKIFGIVDRDAGGSEQDLPEGVVFAPHRYALENIILDPVAVGLLLVREQIASASEIFGSDIPYFKSDPAHAQRACDYVSQKAYEQIPYIRQKLLDPTASRTVTYEGGASVAVPCFVLDQKGHDWEEWLLTAFPGLRRFKTKLKHAVIDHIYVDMPEWIPSDVRSLFARLLT